jgi:hypothetical protein
MNTVSIAYQRRMNALSMPYYGRRNTLSTHLGRLSCSVPVCWQGILIIESFKLSNFLPINCSPTTYAKFTSEDVAVKLVLYFHLKLASYSRMRRIRERSYLRYLLDTSSVHRSNMYRNLSVERRQKKEPWKSVRS